MSDWSGLPRDLLLKIGKSLDSHFDVLHIRSVCSNWRSSISINLRPRPTLCLLLPWFPLPWNDTDAIGSFLMKSTTCLFKLPADHGQTSITPRFFLASLGENRSGKKYITIPLPCEKLRSEIHHPFVLNLDIFSLVVQELGTEYFISREYDDDFGILIRAAYLNADLDNDDDRFSLVTQDNHVGPLRLFKSGDENGTIIEMEDLGMCYNRCVDFIQFKGKFYYTDLKATTFCIEPSSGASFQVVESSPSSSHLVESCGNLLLVNIISHESPNHRNPVECRVFQLDEKGKKWVLLGSLGGGIVFLGGWHKFFAPAIPGVEGNCIVFLLDHSSNENAYVFDMSSRLTVPLDRRPDLYQLFVPPNTSVDFGEDLG